MDMHTIHIVNPTISIGMPVFNCGRTVAAAITSILNQTLTDWELLIIDDGSTDNTLEIVTSFHDPRITIARGVDNKGLPARLNECVAQARGRFFARMDGDDIAYPERLECQLEFLEQHPDVDLVAGWAVVFRSDGALTCALRGKPTHETIWARPWMGMLMPHSTWLGRVEWFRRDRYRNVALAEDQDLLIRTYRRSRFATVPQVVLGYRWDRKPLSNRLLQRWHVCTSISRYHAREGDIVTAAKCVAGQTAKALAETIARISGLSDHTFQGGAMAIELPEVIRWRSVWDAVNAASPNEVPTYSYNL